MQQEDKKDDQGVYRIGKLSLLQLMIVVGALGVLVTWILQHFQ
jgi:hypothetical protein